MNINKILKNIGLDRNLLQARHSISAMVAIEMQGSHDLEKIVWDGMSKAMAHCIIDSKRVDLSSTNSLNADTKVYQAQAYVFTKDELNRLIEHCIEFSEEIKSDRTNF